MNPSFLFLPKCSSQTNKSCPGRRGEVWRRGHQHACLISLFGPPLFEVPLFLGHYYFWDVTFIESFETFLGHQLNNQNTCKTSSSRLCHLKTIQPATLYFHWCCWISNDVVQFPVPEERWGQVFLVTQGVSSPVKTLPGAPLTASEFFIQPSGFSQMCVSAHFCAFTDALNSHKIRATSQHNCQNYIIVNIS